ncbi:response regulator [bacterium]|nr:response regulator [bacterium]
MAGKKNKVLIVDDDPDLRELLMEALDKKGYLVQTAPSAEEAALLLQERPNIIILDVLLPKMNGFEFCKRIKESKAGQDIPVILMTGVYKQHFQEKEAKIKYGAADYLKKPFTVEQLEELIEINLGLVDRTEVSSDGLGFKTEGSLKTISVEKLFNNIAASGKTGLLKLTRGKMVRQFFFNKGNLSYTQSNIRNDFFSQLLLDKKRISEDQRNDIDQQSKERKMPREKIALLMALISQKDLNPLIEEMNRKTVFRAMKWKDGEYEFKLKEAPPDNIHTVTQETKKIIIQGILNYVRDDQS